MYSILSEILSDKKGGTVFTCFGIWHLIYVGIAVIAGCFIVINLKKREQEIREKIITSIIDIAFALYILDFFLMPFAYGEIDIEKLPFHICTATCVICFISRHNGFLRKYNCYFALLGFISNLVYLIYPAGVMWHQVHPLSYRVVETLIFHGIMTVYGLSVLIYENKQLKLSKWHVNLTVIILITLWAVLGNALYNGTKGDYSHNFNWFFVVRDPFYILPESISPYVMPFINVILFFAVETLICLICSACRKKLENRRLA